MTFEGLITATGEEDQEIIDFGAAGATVTINRKEEKSDISVSKTAQYNENVGIIEYSISVSTKAGTDGSVRITDTFIAGDIVYDTNSPHFPLKIFCSDGSEITDYQLILDDTARPATFTITDLPELKAGESYTITYAAIPAPDDAEEDGYLQYTNKAIAADKTNEAETQINTIVSRSMIYKEGRYNSLTGKVNWTIFLNENLRDIRGYTLSDTITCRDSKGNKYDISLPEKVLITPYSGSEPIGESFEVSLPFTFPSETDNSYDNLSYRVTYETSVPENVPAGEILIISNTAVFGDYEYKAEITTAIPEYSSYGVEKSFISTEDDNRTISWTSVITYPQNTAAQTNNLAYIDWVADIIQQDRDFLPGTHYTTANLLSDIIISGADESVRLTPEQDYTIYVSEGPVATETDGLSAIRDYMNADFSEIDKNVSWHTLEQFSREGNTEKPLTLIKIIFTQNALDKLKGQPIVIRYKTQTDSDELPTDTPLTIPNAAKSPEDSSYAEYRHIFTKKLNKQVSPTGVADGAKDTVSYTDESQTYRSSDINDTLHYRILISNYDKYNEIGEISVTDILPAGTELVKESVILRKHPDDNESFTEATNDSWYLREISETKNSDGTTTVRFTIGHINEFYNIPFGIYYEVSLEENPNIQSGGEQTYTNTAYFDGETDSSTVTVKKTMPLLSKTGETEKKESDNKSETIRYQITVNLEGSDLDPNGDILTLTDTLSVPPSAGAYFKANSIAVYHYNPTKENNLGDLLLPNSYLVQYEEKSHTLTFTLPDKTACVIVYEYAVDQGSTVGDIQISNNAVLTGVAGGFTENNISVESQTSSAGAKKATLTIYKHDAENLENLLPGARFKLERYERQTDGNYIWKATDLTGQNEDGTFVIGENGYTELSFVKYVADDSLYNTVYKLTEITAPTGYKTDGTSHYFVWMRQGEKEEFVKESLGELWEKTGIKPEDVKFIEYSTNDSLYIPNAPTALAVKKVWQTANGETLSRTPEKAVVTLYQLDANNGKNIYQTVELSEKNDWAYTWEELPENDENGKAYRYFVEEEPLKGYKTVYSINNTAGIQSGVLGITNTKTEIYVLPETGGTGQFWYAAAGVLLTGTACAIYFYRRRSRGKEEK